MEILRKNQSGELEINWKCLQEKCEENCCGAFEDPLPNFLPVEGQERFEIEVLEDEENELKAACLDCVKKRDGKTYMSLKNDHTCVLLENGSCSKYPNRPSLCKAYPFYIDLFTGLNVDKTCPGLGSGWTKISDLQVNLKSLLKIYKKHIKEIEKKYVRD